MKPIPAKPRIIIAHVEGSGTPRMVSIQASSFPNGSIPSRRRSPAEQILLSRKQSGLSYDRLIVSGGHDEICCGSGNVACDDQHVVCGWECQSFQNREREDRYRSKCLSDLR